MRSLVENIIQKLNFENTAEKLRYFLILLLVFSLPYDIIYSSILLMALILATLLDISKLKLKRIPRQVVLFQLIFFLGVIGYFYSFNKTQASFLIERQLAILIVPIILPLAINIDNEKLKYTLISLCLTAFFAVIYLFTDAIWKINSDLKTPFFQTLFSGAFFNHQFSKPLGIHAGYLSLYISLSILYILNSYKKVLPISLKFVVFTALFILFAGLFFLASRNIIIVTFFIFIFIFPFYKIDNKTKFFIIMTLILVVCFSFVKNIPYLNTRFSVELLQDISFNKSKYSLTSNYTEPRYERWEGAIELIKKSPLCGYGTGDEIEMLKTEYIKRGFYISYLEQFNAHNQYLSYLIKNGILGFFIFLFALYYYTCLAIKSKNFIHLSFLVLMLAGFYTENILDANKGILFFALFNTCFGYNVLLNFNNKS